MDMLGCSYTGYSLWYDRYAVIHASHAVGSALKWYALLRYDTLSDM